jgi:hypothetical protein
MRLLPKRTQRTRRTQAMLKKNRLLIAVVIILLGSAVLFTSAPGSAQVAPDAAYVQSFEKWKAEQIDDLKQNWLPLAGLYWLKPGVNSFGTAAENGSSFPKARRTPENSISRGKTSPLSCAPKRAP